ncbi:MAG: PIN domain-containing protein [Caldilineaceae bacterium]|nr:PIN domain-containing protein [Caldilineaceae bacterium]
MSRAVIVDTSALYALVDRNDPNHAAAVAYLRSCTKQERLLLSNHVFDETMTLTKMRLGIHVALPLGMRLRNSQIIEFAIFNEGMEMALWRTFSQYKDKAWSYTDCASLVLAQARGIQEAFAFDHYFGQMGLVKVP